MQDRAKIAYDVFRGGFGGALRVPPHWDALDSWIRDALVVSYAQGKIDGNGAFNRAYDQAKAEAYAKQRDEEDEGCKVFDNDLRKAGG